MMLKKKPSFSYAGRIMALPFATLLLLAFTMRTKALPRSEQPFALPTAATTDTLPKKDIQSITINKKADTSITITYKDGSRKTYTQKEAEKEGLLKAQKEKTAVKITTASTAPKPLYIVDGKEFNQEINDIDPKNIASVNVLKGESATKKYGKKGENGVIEITLKKSADETLMPRTDNNIVFSEAESPAAVDQQTWRRFLEENTEPVIREISKQAPSGKYTVNVQFIVNKDGSLSDVKAMNDPGYNITAKVLELMKQAPKWQPATQNGQLVRSYHTQPITFVISEGKAIQ